MLRAHEDFKKSFKALGEPLTTVALCSQNGLEFVPMVIEAHGGGWGPAARRILDAVARTWSAMTADEPEQVSLNIAQRLSCSLHRESARAVLRRLGDGSDTESCPAWSPGAPLPLWQ